MLWKLKKVTVGILVVVFRQELCTSYRSTLHHLPPPVTSYQENSRMVLHSGTSLKAGMSSDSGH